MIRFVRFRYIYIIQVLRYLRCGINGHLGILRLPDNDDYI